MDQYLRAFRPQQRFWLALLLGCSMSIVPARVTRAQPDPPLPTGEALPQCGTTPAVESQGPGNPQGGPSSAPLAAKQRKEFLKSNLERMKRDADELVALAKSLQEDVNGSSENVLSLKIVDKAEKIERLARKIKSAAKGY